MAAGVPGQATEAVLHGGTEPSILPLLCRPAPRPCRPGVRIGTIGRLGEQSRAPTCMLSILAGLEPGPGFDRGGRQAAPATWQPAGWLCSGDGATKQGQTRACGR